jgi:hypothetical protein
MSAVKSRPLVLVPLFCLVLIVGQSAARDQVTQCPPGCGPGRWSLEAVDLSSESGKAPYESRDIRIASPDQQKTVRIVKDRWWVEIGGRKISPNSKTESLLYPAELAWAPDSRALYITQSVGYSTGYHTEVYRLKEDDLHLVTGVNETIQRDFERQHKCDYGQLPNVAGLKWLGDSEQLVRVAEVPPVGICP